MGPAGHRVARLRVDVLQPGQRPQRPLDALARTEQPPGQQVRPVVAVARRAGVAGRAVRDDRDLGGVHPVAADQALTGGVGHGDHRVGGGHDPFEHRSLQGVRRAQHGVQHDDDRYLQRPQQRQDLGASVARVDAVLVLHDRDVEPVERVGRGGPAAGRVGAPRVHHPRSVPVDPQTALVVAGDQPDHAATAGRRVEMRGQGGIECRQPALGGRVGAEKAVRRGHDWPF
jgi:hypothetical protein